MKNLKYIVYTLVLVMLAVWFPSMTTVETVPFFSTGIVLNEKGEMFLTQKLLQRIDRFAPDGKTLLKSYPLDDEPTGLVIRDNKAYVTTFKSVGKLQIIDLTTGALENTVVTGSGACYPLFGPDAERIYVCNQFQNTVTEIDLRSSQVVRTVKVLREPVSAIFSKDGRYMYVTNYLPVMRADLDYVACHVSVIDMASFTKVKDILLANGSNALRGITMTPDGKYIYVAHNLGRYTVPTSQLQQGWMNTSAFSVIDTENQSFAGVIVVDEPERGAAGIWNMDCDEKSVYILHSGTHEVSIIDHAAMRDKFEKYPNKELLDYDLNFLYGIRKRIPLGGNGPRILAKAHDKLFIPTYFADVLNIIDVNTLEVNTTNMNPGRKETPEHKGEKYFNDAMNCFQNWQSCNGCHPGDARMDGMNWDLMNDGVGNPKNCKSLLFSHVTPPNMISGIRAKAEIAVEAGFTHIQFFNLDAESLECVNSYLKGLEPVPSPFLVNGELSEKAQKGRKVFEQLRCGDCHNGPYYTDGKLYRIGTDIEFEAGWDTPTLREVWRTGPYLFDGRAETMQEVFEVHKHGINKKISKEEVEALSEYVNSL